MSVDEFIPNWIYTFLILPILVLYQKHFSIKNRVTILETRQDFYTKKVDKMCKSSDELAKEVHEMIGKMDEHLRSNSS